MPRDTPFQFQFDSPAAALAALLPGVRPVGHERVLLAHAGGRVFAEDVHVDRPSPAVDVSSMDGFAVRAAEASSGATLKVVGEVRIGREPAALPTAERVCFRIVTGGPIPPGADAVVKREDVAEQTDAIEIHANAAVRSGDNIRRAGENMPPGALAAARGSVITGPVAGALAAFGCAEPRVFERLKVRVITTGDELVKVDEQPTPCQLRDSNGPALLAMLSGLSFVEARHVHVKDDAHALAAEVASALRIVDALFLTGGVSMGHRDYVADAVAAAGVRPVFHGLPQRPGKPVLGGVTPDGKPVLALPGNPVSVLVTARRLAVPALLARAGAPATSLGAPSLVAVDGMDAKTIDLWWHKPVRLDRDRPGRATLIGPKSSGDIGGAAQSDGFVEVPPGASGSGPWPFYSWRV